MSSAAFHVAFASCPRFVAPLTTGESLFIERQRHSTKPCLNSTKALPSVTLGKEDSALLLSAKSVCGVQCRGHLAKSLLSTKFYTRQTFFQKIIKKILGAVAATAPLAGVSSSHHALHRWNRHRTSHRALQGWGHRLSSPRGARAAWGSCLPRLRATPPAAALPRFMWPWAGHAALEQPSPTCPGPRPRLTPC